MRSHLKSLPESHGTVRVAPQGSFFKKLLAFTGPGYLIAVGYMDPGNWATDLAAGSKFGYSLLFIVLLANLMAVLLQHLSLKLGIVTSCDLAQACARFYNKPTAFVLWILAEISIMACDLAEVIGSAIGLNLLFGIPLVWGVLITGCDVLLLLGLAHKNFRYLENLVIFLMVGIFVCFGITIALAQPDIGALCKGLLPSIEIIKNSEMLYLAVGILGATVMPHNLYLHSAVVQTRSYGTSVKNKQDAIQFATIDSTLALCFAFFINAAILIVAAAVFHVHGYVDVSEIQQAHGLLTPLLGTQLAGIVFAIALLISGQNSTITGTLAGQIIMEGFINFKLQPWLRRLISRGLALVPAILTIIFFGEEALAKLMILSQVILSMQLPFAVFPLVQFTSSKTIMGTFCNKSSIRFAAYAIAGVITFLNIWLVWSIAC